MSGGRAAAAGGRRPHPAVVARRRRIARARGRQRRSLVLIGLAALAALALLWWLAQGPLLAVGHVRVRGYDRLQLDQDVRECLLLTMAMTVLGGATAPTPGARSKAVIDTLVERVGLAVDDLAVAPRV